MLFNLINKELRAIILSPKFIGTFAICSILIIISILMGIHEYKSAAKRYEAAIQLEESDLLESTSWARMSTKVYRAPDPMQIFVSGLDYDIGRWSQISEETTAKLRNSSYSEDPIFALFRFIDFTFIVQFILTLFALLFTYDAINGERENGTLKLVFSNSVSRASYLVAKSVGAWLGLVIPIMVPILLGLLLIIFYQIPLTSGHWIKIGIFMSLSLALFTFFIIFGVFISSVTRHSSISFLISLVCWLLFVLIIPRAGIMTAGHLVHVPRVAEIEGQINSYSMEKWNEYEQELSFNWSDAEDESASTSDCSESVIDMSDEALWEMMQRSDSIRHEVEQDIIAYDLKVHNDLMKKKSRQEKVAFGLSRISPASAYQLGSMTLAGTDIDMKLRYEESINNFRNEFFNFVQQKQKETGDNGQIIMAVTVDEEGNQSTSVGGNRGGKDKLDLGELPRYTKPTVDLAASIAPVAIDFGLIALYTLLSFMGAFIAFIRYDLR